MKTSKLNTTKKNTDRETLVYGYSWLRYPLFAALIFQAFYISNYPNLGLGYIFTTLAFIFLYILFKNARKIQHNHNYLFLIRDKNEIKIPFNKIISIKKSRSRVNGSRFWKLKYFNDVGETKTIRFFSDFNKEFHNLVKKANPEVIIWTHPHFHD